MTGFFFFDNKKPVFSAEKDFIHTCVCLFDDGKHKFFFIKVRVASIFKKKLI